MRLRALAFTVVSLLVASFLFGQVRDGTVEISPFAGYLFGGRFARGTTALFNSSVDVDNHFTYGARIGYNVSSKFEIEAQVSRAQTAFVTHDGGALFGSGTVKLGDLDIDYLLGYMTFNFGHGRAVPYITLGAGAARLDPSVPHTNAQRETRFTASLGAGLKVFFNPHFGMRFDGRYYATSLGTRTRCDSFFDTCTDRTNWLSNGDVTGGLVFAF